VIKGDVKVTESRLKRLSLPLSQTVGYTFHAGDLFHVGHLNQLRECKEHCGFLVVGVLTDQAITAYKRLPIIPYAWRADIYVAIKFVDLVVPQANRDPTDNLKMLNPDVLFHGDDCAQIPGRAYMKSIGGKVVLTPYFHGISTSSIMCEIIKRLDVEFLVDQA